MSAGGEWLGAARTWMQETKINGSDVRWGSDQQLAPYVTVREIEELAERVATAAVNEYRRKACQESAPPIESKWLPIVDAPKDGTPILMRFVGRRPYVTGVVYRGGCFVQQSDYSLVEYRTATGWMPQPGPNE